MTRAKTIRQAVILAGGEGRRLSPYSKVLPKPLWPVGDIPIVEVLLRQLSKAGVRNIIMAVGFQAELIKVILGDGSQFGVKIKYSLEKKPLGTTGPLKKITGLDSNFLVLNGDLLTNINFRDFIRTHITSGQPATIAAFQRSVKIDFGIIEEEDDEIIDYREKPSLKPLVSAGIYAFNKSILDFIPNKRYDFPDLVKRLIRNGLNPGIYRFKGHWLDIGRPDDWEKADQFFRRKKKLFLK